MDIFSGDPRTLDSDLLIVPVFEGESSSQGQWSQATGGELAHRKVGSGDVGPISSLIRERYFDAVRGRLPEYKHWLTEIPSG